MVLSLVFSHFFYYHIEVRIFKYRWFHRFAGKEGITDSELKEIVHQLENGQFYADLGGGVYKMELARKGKGKHSSYRQLLCSRASFAHFLHTVFLNLK